MSVEVPGGITAIAAAALAVFAIVTALVAYFTSGNSLERSATRQSS
jgi:hypothetical protein